MNENDINTVGSLLTSSTYWTHQINLCFSPFTDILTEARAHWLLRPGGCALVRPCSFTSVPRGSRLTKGELRLFSNLFMLVISVAVDRAFTGTGYCGSSGKESACKAGDLGSIPGLGRSPGEAKVGSLQYSSLENSMGCTVHGSQRVRHNWASFTFTVWALCIFGDEFLVSNFSCKCLFSHSEGCLFRSFRVALPVQKFFRLMRCLFKV